MTTQESGRETARGLRTLGTTVLLDLVMKRLSPTDIAGIWNEYLAIESSETLHLSDGSKKRVANTFTDSRRVFRDAFRRARDKSEKLHLAMTGELEVVGQEKAEPMVVPVPVAPKPAPLKASRPLSALEQRMIVSSGGKVGLTPPGAVMDELDPDMARELALAADEAQQAMAVQQNFIEWTCQEADALLKEHQKNEGEALWSDPIKVRSFPADLTKKAIFVLSSTAPLMRDVAGSPTVKHDFRANDQPVTHSHPEAFKQADGLKVIRSKVFKKGHHEYYVKALNYVNGMYIKGYFVVDGTEDPNTAPPRFYQVRWEQAVRISAEAYQEITNRLAAGKPLLEPFKSADTLTNKAKKPNKG